MTPLLLDIRTGAHRRIRIREVTRGRRAHPGRWSRSALRASHSFRRWRLAL